MTLKNIIFTLGPNYVIGEELEVLIFDTDESLTAVDALPSAVEKFTINEKGKVQNFAGPKEYTYFKINSIGNVTEDGSGVSTVAIEVEKHGQAGIGTLALRSVGTPTIGDIVKITNRTKMTNIDADENDVQLTQ